MQCDSITVPAGRGIRKEHQDEATYLTGDWQPTYVEGIGNSSGISKLCYRVLEGGVDIGHATASAAGRRKLGLVGHTGYGCH